MGSISAPKIYDYSDYRDFLKVVGQRFLTGKQCAPSRLRWAQKLGYRSQRSIGMVLNGTRLPSMQMLRKLSSELQLSDTEHRYFELLVERERRERRGKPSDDIIQEMRRVRPSSEGTTPVDPRVYSYIADWYHLVIKQILQTEGKSVSAEGIARRMRKPVLTPRIREAIDRMVEIGIFEREEGTHNVRIAKDNLRLSTDDVPCQALKNHHIQMMQRSVEALKELPPTEREVISVTLRFDSKSIRSVKERIRQFAEEIASQHGGDGKDVFQLNIQFFPHTKTSAQEDGQ